MPRLRRLRSAALALVAAAQAAGLAPPAGTWGTSVRLSAPPWRLPGAVVGLGTAGRGRLWVLSGARAAPPSELLEVDPRRRQVLSRVTLPPGVVAYATAPDAAAFVARPLVLEEWWASRHQRFPMPTGTEAVALAPVSHTAVWVAFRLGTTGRVEVGLYRLPDEVLVDAHHVAGMANEEVASIAAAPGGCWVASAPRPSLYWVPAEGGPSTYTRSYATLVTPAAAGALTTVAVDAAGEGWVSGTTIGGRPALWRILGDGKVGGPYQLTSRVDRVGPGLGVSPSGTGYVAVAGAGGVPGLLGVTPEGAATATFWPSLAPRSSAGKGALDAVLIATLGRLFAATQSGLLLSLQAVPSPTSRATAPTSGATAYPRSLSRRSTPSGPPRWTETRWLSWTSN
jgi:hypothetical protein